MDEEWFEIANPGHFWIQRRFEVFHRLAGKEDWSKQKLGEIGCGRGLLQRQFEAHYQVKVDGFDLSDSALLRSVATTHRRFCYNIQDRNPDFAAAYDALILFDVLEHITDQEAFLEAVLFHLKPGGSLVINVPAFMAFYSRYDEVLGHQRRYTLDSLNKVCRAVGLFSTKATYWGLPWTPLLMMRKLLLRRATDPQRIVRRGYCPPSRMANTVLGALGRLEPLPQRWFGASLMSFCRRSSS